MYTQDRHDLRRLMGLTEVDAAQNQYARTIQILDDDRQKEVPSLLLNTATGNSAARAGRLDDAIGAFQQLIEGNPGNFDPHMRPPPRQHRRLPRPADPNVADTLAFVVLKRNEPQSAANLLLPLPAQRAEVQRTQSKLR